MANLPIPKGYQRMGAFPLDASTVFDTLANLQAYAQFNGTAYAGQICSVVEGSVTKVYKINPDKTVEELVASTNFGEFP